MCSVFEFYASRSIGTLKIPCRFSRAIHVQMTNHRCFRPSEVSSRKNYDLTAGAVTQLRAGARSRSIIIIAERAIVLRWNKCCVPHSVLIIFGSVRQRTTGEIRIRYLMCACTAVTLQRVRTVGQQFPKVNSSITPISIIIVRLKRSVQRNVRVVRAAACNMDISCYTCASTRTHAILLYHTQAHCCDIHILNCNRSYFRGLRTGWKGGRTTINFTFLFRGFTTKKK